MMNKRAKCQRSGFATFSAVVLIGTTAMALMMFAGITIRQLERASTEATDAQLRQLLLAGQAHLQDATPESLGEKANALALPRDLSRNSEVSLIMESGPGLTGQSVVTVTANHLDRTASQTLVYDKSDQAWRLVDVLMP